MALKNNDKYFLLTVVFILAVIFAMVTVISSALAAAVVVLGLIVLAVGLLFYITFRVNRFLGSLKEIDGPDFPVPNLRPTAYRPGRLVAHNLAGELGALGFVPIGAFQSAETGLYCEALSHSEFKLYAVIIEAGRAGASPRVDLSAHYLDGGVFRIGDSDEADGHARPPELVRLVYPGYNPAHLLEIMLRERPDRDLAETRADGFSRMMEDEYRRLEQWPGREDEGDKKWKRIIKAGAS